jgi:NodT family efflux transporter outer membrane factor (OMF) lipoprotein
MHSHHNTRPATSRGLPALAAAVALFGVILTLGGCAVGPKYKKPETAAPENWRDKASPKLATQTPADSLWWKSFNDPALDKLVELAYTQNLPLQVAGLRIVESRARLGIATGKKWPQVQVAAGSVGAVGISESTAPVAGYDRNFVDYQLGFDAIWELDLWGKYKHGIEAEAAGLLASVSDYKYALVSLTAEVARTYAVIRTFEVLTELARENARLQEDGLRIAESRFRNGATSELDVSQAMSLLESTRASIPQLQIGRQQSVNALCTLLGQPTGTVDALLTGAKEIPAAPATVAVGLPAEMLRRRPDIQSAELAAVAQCAQIGVAKADLYPSLSLFGTLGTQASSGGGTSFNLFSVGSIFYSIGPRLVWPFFNYGRIKNNVRVQDARLQQLLVNYRNVVLKASQEVEDALAGFLNSQEALVFWQGSVKAAQRSVEISLIQYREGAVDYQRVLDAERSLLQQQNSLAQTRSSITTSLVALYKALGGGWEVREGQPVVPESTVNEMKSRTNWGDLLTKPKPPETKKNPETEKY